MTHTIYDEARKRTIAKISQRMDDHFQKTGEITVPEVSGSEFINELIDLSKSINFYRRSDLGKKRKVEK